MEDIIKISLLSMPGVLIALNFKAEKPQFSLLLGMAMGIFVLGFCTDRMVRVMNALESLKEYLGAGGNFLGTLMRVLAVTYICEFASSTCRDAGYGVLAEQVEILGKLTVMLSGLSVLFTVIDQIQTLI